MTAKPNPWIEQTYGSRWPSTPSPQKYQIWRMECIHCDFHLDPGRFRRYDDSRVGHEWPYGNFASIAHARKLMREHAKTHQQEAA
jgi:hypothetical protein